MARKKLDNALDWGRQLISTNSLREIGSGQVDNDFVFVPAIDTSIISAVGQPSKINLKTLVAEGFDGTLKFNGGINILNEASGITTFEAPTNTNDSAKIFLRDTQNIGQAGFVGPRPSGVTGQPPADYLLRLPASISGVAVNQILGVVDTSSDEPELGFLSNPAPIGSVVAFPSETIPEGWLVCNGNSYNNTDYPELAAVIGTKYNGGGDPSTVFRTPDLRGVFIRGLDQGRGQDPGRTLSNTIQEDAFQQHQHPTPTSTVVGGSNTLYKGLASQGNNPTGDANGRTADETRPKNIALVYIIRAR